VTNIYSYTTILEVTDVADKCMLCGKPIEEPVKKAGDYVDEYDDDNDDPFSSKKPSQFCLMCQAKLKNAADKGQKNPKPM